MLLKMNGTKEGALVLNMLLLQRQHCSYLFLLIIIYCSGSSLSFLFQVLKSFSHVRRSCSSSFPFICDYFDLVHLLPVSLPSFILFRFQFGIKVKVWYQVLNIVRKGPNK